MTEVKEGM